MSNDSESISFALVALFLFILTYVRPRIFEKQSRFRKVFFLAVAVSLVPILLLMMPFVVVLRGVIFWSIQKDRQLMKKHVGYWKRIETGSLRYELVYETHADGTLIFHAVYFEDNRPPRTLMNYRIRYKFFNGNCYERTAFSQISVDKIIELDENHIVMIDSSFTGDRLHDVRINKDEYDRKKIEFSTYAHVSHWLKALTDLLQGPGVFRKKKEARNSPSD